MNNPENKPLLVNGTETPSAGELHDMLMEYSQSGFIYPLCAELKYVAKFLLKQQAEIDTYKSQNGSQIDTYRYKELTDEEINVVAILQDAEIVPVGHEIWKTSEEFNKYKRIVLATAKALRKAQEK